jgi:predicted ATPase
VAQSDVFIGIYWQDYGWVAPGLGVSGIADEYQLSAGRPCLMYVREPAPQRDPRLDELLDRIKADDRVCYRRFTSAEQLAELVADDLALLLTEHFTPEARAHAQPRRRIPTAVLPTAPNVLVGRTGEVARVAALLRSADVRLVTLTGPGGVGKTRLALAVAREAEPDYADGVAFVDLSSIRDPQLVATAVAGAVGLRPEGSRPVVESVIERLAGARLLLVLDNFEHLITAAPVISRLLAACAGLNILVTSRTHLRVRGEHEIPVAPLDIPTAGDADLEAVPRSGAVRLFVERARESKPAFELDGSNVAAVAELCRRLDGVPLAIELAAARMNVVPPGLLLDRLGDRLDLLTGAADLPVRQRTLRATIDWSYELLTTRERAYFRALSVFVGGFTLEAAEVVCATETGSEVLEVVSSLVENSLVVPQEGGSAEPRFRMLETVREYAWHQLERSGQTDEIHRRMAEYFTGFAEKARLGSTGREHRVWMDRIDAEYDNVRAVVAWTFAHEEYVSYARIVLGIGPYAWSHGHAHEQRPGLEQLLERRATLDPHTRGVVLFLGAGARVLTGDGAAAVPLMREALQIAEQGFADEVEHAMLKAQYGVCASPEAAPEARALLAEAAATLSRLGNGWGAAYALSTLGQLVLRAGDIDEAERLQSEALGHARAIGSDQFTGIAVSQLGMIALARGEVDTAHTRFLEGARLFRAIPDREGLAYDLDGLAAVALADGDTTRAVEVLALADAIRARIGITVWPLMSPIRENLESRIRAAAGSGSLDSARAAAAAEPDLDTSIGRVLAEP